MFDSLYYLAPVDVIVLVAAGLLFSREAGRQKRKPLAWGVFGFLAAPIAAFSASLGLVAAGDMVAGLLDAELPFTLAILLAAAGKILTAWGLWSAYKTLKAEDPRGPLEVSLGVFTDVEPGEGGTALLMTLNIFALLTAYYFIKPVREALILVMPSGAEYKAYMNGAIAVTLLFAVPAYARAANRLARNRLVVGVTLFFLSHLVVFYVLSNIEIVRQYLGLVFYLWVGIFNMMVVAQFWAFANDIYQEEQGKRLFPLIGIGASVGAAVGSKIAAVLIQPLGVYQMLLLAGALLGLCSFLTQVIHVRETKRAKEDQAPAAQQEADDKPKGAKKGAFAMVFKYRYLTLIAIFSLVFTFVNTNGEYMLGKLIKRRASEQVEQLVTREDANAWIQREQNLATARAYYEANADEFEGHSFDEIESDVALAAMRNKRSGGLIGAAFGNFFFYVNVLGVFLQMFIVSRLIRYVGFKPSFFVLPVIALADAVAVAILPSLTILRIGKTAENATDYSLNNTLRNMLWLPTTTAMKYQAKQAVDTFFVRMGDVSNALLVALGALLAWEVRAFAISNVVLVAVWLVVAGAIVREQSVIKRMREAGELED